MKLYVGFEQSPFKLTPEFVEVMDGPDSELFMEFRKLLVSGLKAARKQQDRIVNIVEIMRSSKLKNISQKTFNNKNSSFRHSTSVFQKWLFSYRPKSTKAIPHESY